MKKIVLLFITISTLISCKSQTKEPVEKNESTKVEQTIKEVKNIIQVLDVTSYKNAINNDVQLVDVRTPKEYNQGFIKNAKNIDYFSDDFKTQFESYNKEQPIYLYCRSGGRSGKASKILKELGFKEIYDLKGGYLAWSKQ